MVIGAGGIGTAIARRQGFGKAILLADWNEQLLEAPEVERFAAVAGRSARHAADMLQETWERGYSAIRKVAQHTRSDLVGPAWWTRSAW